MIVVVEACWKSKKLVSILHTTIIIIIISPWWYNIPFILLISFEVTCGFNPSQKNTFENTKPLNDVEMTKKMVGSLWAMRLWFFVKRIEKVESFSFSFIFLLVCLHTLREIQVILLFFTFDLLYMRSWYWIMWLCYSRFLHLNPESDSSYCLVYI